MFQRSYTLIKTLHEESKKDLGSVIDKDYIVKGKVRFLRTQAKRMFMHIYDGSHPEQLQCMIDDDKFPGVRSSVLDDLSTGATVVLTGTIVKSPAKGQLIEMVVKMCKVIGKVKDRETYIPTIKQATYEVLREHQDVRAYDRSMQAINRVRSMLHKFVEEFFVKVEGLRLDPNIVTKADCEGAGETFVITTLLKEDDVKSIPLVDKTTQIDFSQDFFTSKAYLTVSSQLQLEALCHFMGLVYTMNPSFRAEKSRTSRHLACFTHLEWEIPYIELKDLMDFSEDLTRYCFERLLSEGKLELAELQTFCPYSKGMTDKLLSFIAQPYARISYDEAIDIVKRDGDKIIEKFKGDVKELPKWGDDLGSFCERYICECVTLRPTFVYNYPRELKSFYMKQNPSYVVDEVERHTVQGCDLLIPGLGELIGSSIREDDYDTLMQEMQRRKMADIPWYTDLRKNGSVPTGGAGLGFDRLVSVCTMTEGNIREVVPFYVTYQDCQY